MHNTMEKKEMMTIDWNKIDHMLLDSRLSKLERAKRSGVHHNTFYRRGTFKSSTVDRLAQAFGCHPFELIKLVPEEQV